MGFMHRTQSSLMLGSTITMCPVNDTMILVRSFSVQRKHCAVEVKKGEGGAKGTVVLIGGRGDVWHNGKPVRKQEQVSRSVASPCWGVEQKSKGGSNVLSAGFPIPL